MDLISHLALGFGTALSPDNLFYCFLGVLLGTFIGVLPGLGPTATIAMLLPFTYGLSPTAALIMLAGIYYGVAVRRLDDGDPGEPAGRGRPRSSRHRRLPDGAPGPRRHGARHGGARLVHRRHRRDAC